MSNVLVEGGIKAAKMAASVLLSAAIVEGGYVASKVFCDDIDFTAQAVDRKINPKVMKKEHFWSKARPYNLRTGQYVTK